MNTAKTILSDRFKNDRLPHRYFTNRLMPEAMKTLKEFDYLVESGVITYEKPKHCPSCGSEQKTIIAEKDRLGVYCETVICPACKLIYNNTPLIGDSAEKFYREFWGKIQWAGNPNTNFENRIKKGAYCWGRQKKILNVIKATNAIKDVLEIGCGDGANLYPWFTKGFNVCGYDMDDTYLSIGRATGMDLRNGDVLSIDTKDKFDIIILSHVFEHFYDLNLVIAKVKKLIRPEGYIYIEVPGVLMTQKFQRRKKIDNYSTTNDFLAYIQFQHNYHFTLSSLLRFWCNQGFELLYGDEVVRCILRYSPSSRNQLTEYSYDNTLLDHLVACEKNYLSWLHQSILYLKSGVKKVLSKVC